MLRISHSVRIVSIIMIGYAAIAAAMPTKADGMEDVCA